MSARALTTALALVGIGTLLILGWWFYQMRHATELTETKQDVSYVQTAPPITAADPRLGPELAKTTVVAFMDFGCEPCRKAFNLVQELHNRLPHVAFVWKDLPDKGDVVPAYRSAHIAARCAAGYGKFWEYAQVVFDNQTTLGTMDWVQTATDLGMSKTGFQACMRSPAAISVIDANAAQAHERGISSTPFFFINNTRVDGLQPINAMYQLILSTSP